MKLKKMLASAAALAVSATMCLSFVACGGNDDDGDKHTHAYGEWVINKLPTQKEAGSASKYCANDAAHEHDITATLPILTEAGTGYRSVSDTAGRKTYVLENANGNITFEAVSVFDMEDAVAAALLTNREPVKTTIDANSVIRRAKIEGLDGEDFVKNEELSERFGVDMCENVSSTESLYEYGENYVHIKNGAEKTEGFYLKDAEGNLHAVLERAVSELDEEWNPIEVTEVVRDEAALKNENLFDGFGFKFVYFGDAQKFGVGPFIDYLYTYASENNPFNSFKQEMTSNEGETVYTFGFNEYADGFHVINVSFSLNEDFVVTSAEFDCKSYPYWSDIGAGETSGLVKGTITPVKDGDDIVYDENGKPTYIYEDLAVIEGQEDYWMYRQSFSVSQKTELAEGESAPVLPEKYQLKNMQAKSFSLREVYVNWDNTVTERNLIEKKISLEPTQSFYIRFEDVLPVTTNFNFDIVKCYLRAPDGEEELLSDSYTDGRDGHVVVSFNNKDSILTIKPYVAGNFTLVIKTANTENVLEMEIPAKIPQTFGTAVYQYNEATESGVFSSATEFNVYVGQKLYFTSMVGNPAYENADYTVQINGKNVTLETEYITGTLCSVFENSEAGNYTITLISSANETKKSSFLVHVISAPNMNNVLNGVFKNEKENVQVTFDNGEVSIVIKGSTTTADYTYENGVITVTNATGGHADFNFGFRISQDYNVYLTYKDTDFNISYDVLLTSAVQQKDTVLGDHVTTTEYNEETFENIPEKTPLNISTDGVYRVTMDPTIMAYKISVNDEETAYEMDWMGAIENEVELDLKAGDVLTVYTMMTGTWNYSVELVAVKVSETLSVKNAVSLYAGTSVSVLVSGALNGYTCVSSDQSVVTVDTNGVVTGVAAGNATVSVMDADRNIVANCSISVKAAMLVTEFDNDISLGAGASVEFKFYGVENEQYSFVPSEDVTLSSGSETNNGSGMLVLTTDANGLATVTVSSATAIDVTVKVVFGVVEVVGNEGVTGGQGTARDPWKIAVGTTVKLVENVSDDMWNPTFCIIEIEEDGMYTITSYDGSGLTLQDGTAEDAYVILWDAGEKAMLTAGTYYVSVYSYSGTAEFTVEKI